MRLVANSSSFQGLLFLFLISKFWSLKAEICWSEDRCGLFAPHCKDAFLPRVLKQSLRNIKNLTILGKMPNIPSENTLFKVTLNWHLDSIIIAHGLWRSSQPDFTDEWTFRVAWDVVPFSILPFFGSPVSWFLGMRRRNVKSYHFTLRNW